MTASDKHRELHGKLIGLLQEFHAENPDLFVNDIDVKWSELLTGHKVLMGMSVTIRAQPFSVPNAVKEWKVS